MAFRVGTQFTVIQFNLENFFVYLDQASSVNPSDGMLERMTETEWQKQSISLNENKPLEHVRAIAKTILDLRADVYMLCEVGGEESLKNFAKFFLKDQYLPYIIEGNSDRGIDLGYLVRKDAPYKYDLRTHKDRPIDYLYPHERQSQETGFSNGPKSLKFSRDVLELRIFEEGASRPNLVCLNVHLKSQLNKDHVDPFGRERRQAELEKLLDIYNEIANEFNREVPMLVAGDFNGVASRTNTDPEFMSIYSKTLLHDVLDHLKLPTEKRITHAQFPPYAKAWFKQFDYIFVSPQLQPLIDPNRTFVYRFKDEFGFDLALPTTLNEKRQMPSDHYPVVATFHF